MSTARRPKGVARQELEDELEQVIGRVAVTRLIEKFGGTRVYVPRTMTVHHDLAEALGMKAAAMLSREYPLEWIELPKPHRRRKRALDAALSGEMTVREVALSFDYTERMIYKMLADHRTAEAEGRAQLNLFD